MWVNIGYSLEYKMTITKEFNSYFPNNMSILKLFLKIKILMWSVFFVILFVSIIKKYLIFLEEQNEKVYLVFKGINK